MTASSEPWGSIRSSGKVASSVEAVGWRQQLKHFVASPYFEVTFAGLIVVNTFVMAAQNQYVGLDAGHALKYPGCNRSSDELWPSASVIFDSLELVFGIAFTFELIVKLAALSLHFFVDSWNVLDFFIIVCWLVDSAAKGILVLSPMLLRLLRLVRLFRMLRLIRSIQSLDPLYILLRSITGSLFALMWSVTLLLVLLMVIALVLTTTLESYCRDLSIPIERRSAVFDYFGTFFRALLTLFELALGNWATASRVLTENVSELWIFFVLAFQVTIGFSVVKVIMGVFLHVTFHVASTDDAVIMSATERAIRLHTKKIKALFEAADADGNGRLDEDEFAEMADDTEVTTWLGAMGFEMGTFNHRLVYKLLTHGGQVDLSAEELVRGVSKLKGDASSLNLALAHYNCKQTCVATQKLKVSVDDLLELVSSSCPPGRPEQVSKFDEPPEDEVEEGWMSFQRRRSVSSTLFVRPSIQAWEAETIPLLQRAQEKLYKLVTSFFFDSFFAIAIGVNACLMAMEIQYQGIETGYQLRFQNFTRPAAEVWISADDVFFVTGVFFGVIFSIEVALKLLVLGWHFFTDKYNTLDMVIIVLWYVEVALDTRFLPLDPLLLRLARLLKLLRMLRLLKFLERSDSLYLMLASIKASVGCLVWSSVLLIMVQLLAALSLATLLEDWLLSEDTGGDKHKVYSFFGTFSTSMLTMFEITLGNWIPVTRIMIENVNEIYALFALTHKLFVGFAVMMVITGIFVRETMQCAKMDNRIMLFESQGDAKLHMKKMGSFFAAADTDGNGVLDADEFREICRVPEVATWCEAMGVNVLDADAVHEQLCTWYAPVEKEITSEHLVLGMLRLKGVARNLDLAAMRAEQKQLQRQIQELHEQVRRIESMHKPTSEDQHSGFQRSQQQNLFKYTSNHLA